MFSKTIEASVMVSISWQGDNRTNCGQHQQRHFSLLHLYITRVYQPVNISLHRKAHIYSTRLGATSTKTSQGIFDYHILTHLGLLQQQTELGGYHYPHTSRLLL